MTKQSEKDYVRRAAAAERERLKPFSPPDTDTVDESARLMHDFSVAVLCLRPRLGDMVLDLGSGACWSAEWLARLNLRVVAVDISLDMLRIGRTRAEAASPPALVAGDLEELPFAAGVFKRALCLNALHHVPDPAKAIREISRVLSSDGAVVLSEPGLGHADQPGSRAVMQDYGVLEQEVLVSELMGHCAAAGFKDVRIKPMAYVLPDFDLTPNDWRAWHTEARRRRPLRAMRKMWRATLELAGAGKKGPLFEEALAASVVRLIDAAMEHHPIVIAHKTAQPRGLSVVYAASVQLLEAPRVAKAGGPLELLVRVSNQGDVGWPNTSTARAGYARLGVQLLDADRKLLNRDYHRTPFQSIMAPGAEQLVRAICPAPPAPGTYHLKLDVVMEGVTWFEVHGSRPAWHRLEITPDTTSGS